MAEVEVVLLIPINVSEDEIIEVKWEIVDKIEKQKLTDHFLQIMRHTPQFGPLFLSQEVFIPGYKLEPLVTEDFYALLVERAPVEIPFSSLPAFLLADLGLEEYIEA